VRVVVDLDLCQGHAVCVSEAPEVFTIGKHDDQVTIQDDSPPDTRSDDVRRAVMYCPTGALSVEED
jgi:ferredoxin